MSIDLRFLIAHPAHFIALGAGSGLSRIAPGTVGTLWAWIGFVLLSNWLDATAWGWTLLAGLPLGWWACTLTARHAGIDDPGFIVWDEVLAFWLVLWVLTPATPVMQLIAFGLFRYFDAAKPGPVRWADRRFKAASGWVQGFGIVFDDLVAAACTLALMLPTRALWT